MLSLTVAACALLGGAIAPHEHGHGCSVCAPPPGKVGELVALAWQEQAALDDLRANLPARHRQDLQSDEELGKKFSEQVEKELKISKNEDMNARLNRIGAEIGAIAQRQQVRVLWGDNRLNPFRYQFRVVEGKEVNAFSLPGGYLYFYEGLMNYVESDDELAGVVAHEIAHAAFRHTATLMREQSRFESISLPLILIAIFSGGDAGQGALALKDLTNQAVASGWSQKAEIAADYGAFQYLKGTSFSPVGLLTFMERLARDQRAIEGVDWGIYRTHPPSRERAERLIGYLREANMPIRRSKVSKTFRVELTAPKENGAIEVHFNGRTLTTFAGPDAQTRAAEAKTRLNAFFDEVPDLFEVTSNADGVVFGRRQALFQLTSADAEAQGVAPDRAAQNAVRAMKRSLYMLAFRIWDAR